MTIAREETYDAHLLSFVLRLADSALIASQRMAEWCGVAPMLEEDIALSNVALDLLGQSRHLFTYASDLEGGSRSEDDFAFLRDPHEYLNYIIAELPNGDFAQSCTKSFLFSSFAKTVWSSLLDANDSRLRDIAAKSLKETNYHVEHFSSWFIRLGDGTDTSRQKILEGLDYVWPYTNEFFDDDSILISLEGVLKMKTNTLWTKWIEGVTNVFASARIDLPSTPDFICSGKYGIHSEHLGHILAEMQYLQRAYPGGRW